MNLTSFCTPFYRHLFTPEMDYFSLIQISLKGRKLLDFPGLMKNKLQICLGKQQKIEILREIALLNLHFNENYLQKNIFSHFYNENKKMIRNQMHLLSHICFWKYFFLFFKLICFYFILIK